MCNFLCWYIIKDNVCLKENLLLCTKEIKLENILPQFKKNTLQSIVCACTTQVSCRFGKKEKCILQKWFYIFDLTVGIRVTQSFRQHIYKWQETYN